MPREQPAPSTSQLGSESVVGTAGNSFVAVSSPASASSILASANPTLASRSDVAASGVAVRAPSVPKAAVKLNQPANRLETPQQQLRAVDVTPQDLPHLQLDDISSFDRESLLQLSALLLSRQDAGSSSVVEPAPAAVSSSGDLSTENARLKATVEILKVRASRALQLCVLRCHG